MSKQKEIRDFFPRNRVQEDDSDGEVENVVEIPDSDMIESEDDLPLPEHRSRRDQCDPSFDDGVPSSPRAKRMRFLPHQRGLQPGRSALDNIVADGVRDAEVAELIRDINAREKMYYYYDNKIEEQALAHKEKQKDLIQQHKAKLDQRDELFVQLQEKLKLVSDRPGSFAAKARKMVLDSFQERENRDVELLIQQKDDKIAQQASENSDLRKEVDRLGALNVSISETLNVQLDTIRQYGLQTAQFIRELDEAKKDNEQAQFEIFEKDAQINKHEVRSVATKSKAKEMRTLLLQSRETIARDQAELSLLQETIDKQDSELAELRSVVDELAISKASLSEAESQQQELEMKLNVSQELCGTRQRDLEHQQEELTRLHEHHTNALNDMKSSQNLLSISEAELRTCRAELSGLQSKLDQQGLELSRCRGDLEISQEETKQATIDLSSCHKTIEESLINASDFEKCRKQLASLDELHSQTLAELQVQVTLVREAKTAKAVSDARTGETEDELQRSHQQARASEEIASRKLQAAITLSNTEQSSLALQLGDEKKKVENLRVILSRLLGSGEIKPEDFAQFAIHVPTYGSAMAMERNLRASLFARPNLHVLQEYRFEDIIRKMYQMLVLIEINDVDVGQIVSLWTDVEQGFTCELLRSNDFRDVRSCIGEILLRLKSKCHLDLIMTEVCCAFSQRLNGTAVQLQCKSKLTFSAEVIRANKSVIAEMFVLHDRETLVLLRQADGKTLPFLAPLDKITSFIRRAGRLRAFVALQVDDLIVLRVELNQSYTVNKWFSDNEAFENMEIDISGIDDEIWQCINTVQD